MESYMSLSMSAFHSRSKWEVKAVAGGGGGQEWESGDRQAVPQLTRSQAEPRLAVIRHQGGQKKRRKKEIHSPISVFVYLSALGRRAGEREQGQGSEKIWQKNSLQGLEYSK